MKDLPTQYHEIFLFITILVSIVITSGIVAWLRWFMKKHINESNDTADVKEENTTLTAWKAFQISKKNAPDYIVQYNRLLRFIEEAAIKGEFRVYGGKLYDMTRKRLELDGFNLIQEMGEGVIISWEHGLEQHLRETNQRNNAQ